LGSNSNSDVAIARKSWNRYRMRHGCIDRSNCGLGGIKAMKLRRKIKMLNRFVDLLESQARANGKTSYRATVTRRRITQLRKARGQGIHV
jgi:hypothetical protein